MKKDIISVHTTPINIELEKLYKFQETMGWILLGLLIILFILVMLIMFIGG